MTRKDRTYWLKHMGVLAEEPAPVVETPPSPRREPGGGDPPKCARCGGIPRLGRCGPEGGIKSLCYSCADEEYLEMLKPEERALLRS
jgi:hypothetical protein